MPVRKLSGRLPLLAVATVLLLSLSGCSFRRSNPVDPTLAQREPDRFLYETGMAELDRKRWIRAREYFRQLVDTYPTSLYRQDAKLGLLGAMYGATSGESGRMVAGLTQRYPAAFGLVEEAARAGERGEVVRTLLGRGCPALGGGSWDESPDAPPDDLDDRDRHRRAYGRFTRNFVVQGTAAEWASCWLADLRTRPAPSPADLRAALAHAVRFAGDVPVTDSPSTDWDRTAQGFLATAALYRATLAADPSARTPSAEAALADIAAALRFPAGQDSPRADRGRLARRWADLRTTLPPGVRP